MALNVHDMKRSTYIAGDEDPSDFSYNTPTTPEEALQLLVRNAKIQKATSWIAREMVRERIIFKKDQPITAKKHGKDFPFPTYLEFLEWIGYWEQLQLGLTWALNFGACIAIFFSEDDNGAETFKKKPYFKAKDTYNSMQVFHEKIDGNGYEIAEVSEDIWQKPTLYKVYITAVGSEVTKEFYVDADRVVIFAAPKLSRNDGGNATVSCIQKDAIAQEQIKRSLVRIMNNLASGILAVKVNDEDEKATIANAISGQFTYLNRVYHTSDEDPENLLKLIVPDFKLDQVESMNNLLQTDIATGSNIPKSVLEGTSTGTVAAAGFDTFNAYTNVKSYQSHFTRSVEETFFKLQKDDTTFEWVDMTPTMEKEDERTDTSDSSSGSDSTGEDLQKDKENTSTKSSIGRLKRRHDNGK